MTILGETRTEQVGQVLHFCLPTALLGGHWLLGKVSLPESLPLPLLEKSISLALCASAVLMDKIFDYEQDGKCISLNVNEIGSGAALGVAFTSFLSLMRGGPLREGVAFLSLGAGVGVWGIDEQIGSDPKRVVELPISAIGRSVSSFLTAFILVHGPGLYARIAPDHFVWFPINVENGWVYGPSIQAFHLSCAASVVGLGAFVATIRYDTQELQAQEVSIYSLYFGSSTFILFIASIGRLEATSYLEKTRWNTALVPSSIGVLFAGGRAVYLLDQHVEDMALDPLEL